MMRIAVEWFTGQFPSFNVALSSGDGKDPFITVKGCRIVDGSNGQFISWPATRNMKTGKYWNHVYASDAFSDAVMAEALKSQPSEQKPQRSRRDESDNEPPF